MRALVFNGPGDMQVQERPDPSPSGDEVLLRVTATGICGSDLHGYTGHTGRRQPGQIMGHETVGRIAEIGSTVPAHHGLTVGALATVNPVIGCGDCAQCAAGTEQLCARRRVLGVEPSIPAAFAEMMIAPAANVVTLPDTVPERYGALVEPLAVGYHAAVRGEVGPDDRVLVVGGGPIGQACALAARRLGAGRVVVSELSPRRRALVSALGFPVLDPAAGDPAEAGRTHLSGAATVVLDAVGTGASIAAGLATSGLGARIVLVGMNEPEVTLAAYAVSTFERALIGSFCYPSGEFRETARWVAAAPSGLEHLIDGWTSLADAPRTFAGLASGALEASKVLVICGQADGEA